MPALGAVVWVFQTTLPELNQRAAEVTSEELRERRGMGAPSSWVSSTVPGVQCRIGGVTRQGGLGTENTRDPRHLVVVTQHLNSRRVLVGLRRRFAEYLRAPLWPEINSPRPNFVRVQQDTVTAGRDSKCWCLILIYAAAGPRRRKVGP